MLQTDLKDICPLIKKEITKGTFEEWQETNMLPNGFEMAVYRNNIHIYSCSPECAIENKCRTTTTLCPIPNNKCDLLCAYTHGCNIKF